MDFKHKTPPLILTVTREELDQADDIKAFIDEAFAKLFRSREVGASESLREKSCAHLRR